MVKFKNSTQANQLESDLSSDNLYSFRNRLAAFKVPLWLSRHLTHPMSLVFEMFRLAR